MFPLSGRYSATVWAEIFGCCRSSVERYVAECDILYRQPGHQMFIDAVDVSGSLPVLRHSSKKSNERSIDRRESRSRLTGRDS